MMKFSYIILFAAMAIVTPYTADSADLTSNKAVAIEYIGQSDKPVFPVIISYSKANAEWYRNYVLKRSDPDLASEEIVSVHQFSEILNAFIHVDNMIKDNNVGTIDEINVIQISTDRNIIKISAKIKITKLITLISKIDKICPDDALLHNDLAEFETKSRYNSTY